MQEISCQSGHAHAFCVVTGQFCVTMCKSYFFKHSTWGGGGGGEGKG